MCGGMDCGNFKNNKNRKLFFITLNPIVIFYSLIITSKPKKVSIKAKEDRDNLSETMIGLASILICFLKLFILFSKVDRRRNHLIGRNTVHLNLSKNDSFSNEMLHPKIGSDLYGLGSVTK